MIAKHLLTSVFVILAFGVADSFAAASIRAGTVGASGTSARAGSLRVGSGASLSTKATTTSSNTATTSTDSSRMPALPMGAPKVTTKPKLPSYSGGTVVSGDVDLSDVYNRIDTVEDKAEAAQSAAAGAQSTADSAVASLAGKLDKPSGGSAGQVLKWASNGVVWGTDETGGTGSGKTTFLRKNGEIVQTCEADSVSECTETKWQNSSVSLETYAKASDLSDLSTTVGNKLDKPSNTGSSGKVLKWTNGGGVQWGDDNSANVQLTTFDNDGKLYYCGKTSGICDTGTQSDGWQSTELSGLKGADGNNGKTAWLRKNSTHVQACYKETSEECSDGDYTNLISLSELKGDPGSPGDPGAPGTPATIEVGTVEAVENDDAPTVTNSGTETAAKFNFKIPKGKDGADGKKVKLQKGSNAIQYQYDGDTTWENLVPLSELKGEDGKMACDSFKVELDNTYSADDGNRYNVICVTSD